VVNSPFEYRAEQKGFKVLLSIKEIAEFVKLPINRLSTSPRKIDREPDEIGRMLRALRNANLFLAKSAARSMPGSGKLLKLYGPGRRTVLCSVSRV
jgi:hypothetical protein